MRLMLEYARMKVDATIVYLQTQVSSMSLPDSPKTLVFAHYTDTLVRLHAFFQDAKIPSIFINGKTKMSDRQERVDRFQSDPTIKVAVLSIKAAGTGFNLFQATRVIFAELLWSEKDMIQAEDRAHRTGQTKVVHIDYVLLDNSCDHIIWESIRRKHRMSGLVLDDVQSTMSIVDSKSNGPPRKKQKTRRETHQNIECFFIQ